MFDSIRQYFSDLFDAKKKLTAERRRNSVLEAQNKYLLSVIEELHSNADLTDSQKQLMKAFSEINESEKDLLRERLAGLKEEKEFLLDFGVVGKHAISERDRAISDIDREIQEINQSLLGVF